MLIKIKGKPNLVEVLPCPATQTKYMAIMHIWSKNDDTSNNNDIKKIMILIFK